MAHTARRPLAFASLDEVMPDVDRLLAGHTTVGRWSLGQICNHLAMAITGSVDGYPGAAPWILRRTFGPLIVRRTLRVRRLPEGVRLPKRFHPVPGVDSRAEAESLRTAIARFAAHAGPHPEHPLGGFISHDDWSRFHAIHAAHHLSFAVPTSEGAENGSARS